MLWFGHIALSAQVLGPSVPWMLGEVSSNLRGIGCLHAARAPIEVFLLLVGADDVLFFVCLLLEFLLAFWALVWPIWLWDMAPFVSRQVAVRLWLFSTPFAS